MKEITYKFSHQSQSCQAWTCTHLAHRRKSNKIKNMPYRSPNACDANSSELIAEEATTKERVNVATLKTVFFHSSTAIGSDRDKRLPVIEEPFSITFQANDAVVRLQGNGHQVEPAIEVKSDENLNYRERTTKN